MELSWWIKLDHPNILPLLEYITLDTCTVFIMPAMRKDLWAVVNEKRFYDEELSFGLCRIWLRDVARALAYLHGQFLCHLDLKLDNVFVKEDGYACLGDFSLLSDIREVPTAFNFLEIYEPPEYTDWCHGKPPPTIANATKFAGDKADMWQFGIVTVDLLSNLKISGSKSSNFTLFHHDVWPVLEKIILHKEYLGYLLERTFTNVVFQDEDLDDCHDFIKSILTLDPNERMSAESAMKHDFVNTEWPQLPKEFTLPEHIVEHRRDDIPLPIEELKDFDMPMEDILKESLSTDVLRETPSKGAFDALMRKKEKMIQEKLNRRESIMAEAGSKLLRIKPAPSILGQLGEKASSGETTKTDVKTVEKQFASGQKRSVKVTSVKKVRTSTMKDSENEKQQENRDDCKDKSE